MADNIYPTKENGLNGPVLTCYVEEAEAAWGHTREEWGWEEADGLDELVITLGASYCTVWQRQPGGDGGRDRAIFLDCPKTTAEEMASLFGLSVRAGVVWDVVAPQYEPSLAYVY